MERVNGELVTAHRLSDSLVRVSVGEQVIGFVESVGPVFVALQGASYDRAVEVAQSLVFDVAVAGLLAHVRVVEKVAGELAKPAARQQKPSQVA